jgi:DNA-binding MarR family transcriptional regulator
VPLPFDPIAEARRQWEAHGWQEPEAMVAATAITRAHQIVIGRVNEALAPFGLTFARYEALVLLQFSRRGSLPLGKMGVRLMVHPTSVTNAIDGLERAGLVRRVRHDTDRRAVLAEITDEGRARVVAATRALERIEFGLGALSGGERQAVWESLVALRADAGDFDGASGATPAAPTAQAGDGGSASTAAPGPSGRANRSASRATAT